MIKKNIWIILTYILSAIILLLTFIVAKKFDLPFKMLTGDPAMNSGQHPFVGVISNLGVLLWCITFSICWFSAYFLLKHNNKNEARFLFYFGGLSFILLIDDFFMFHDYIFNSLKDFKIAEVVTYSVYLLMALYIAIITYKLILKTEYVIFGTAVMFLGLSVLVDVFFINEGIQYFIEDGLKFMGIASWTLYFTRTSYKLILNTKQSF